MLCIHVVSEVMKLPGQSHVQTSRYFVHFVLDKIPNHGKNGGKKSEVGMGLTKDEHNEICARSCYIASVKSCSAIASCCNRIRKRTVFSVPPPVSWEYIIYRLSSMEYCSRYKRA